MLCNAANNYCGTGVAPTYTSDAIGGRVVDGAPAGWSAHDIDGDGIADVMTRSGAPGISYAAGPYGTDVPAGWVGGDGHDYQPHGVTRGTPYLTSRKIGNAIGSCNGQVIQTGTKIQQVDCPTQIPVTERYNVPRTVQTSRVENRTRTRILTKQRQVPETKYRTEVKYVAVTRQVPYQTSRTETYQEPKIETYQVSVPDTKTVIETRTRQRMVTSTKKCSVRVPVYGAKCSGGNLLS